jgi:hypothetical protein
MVETSRLVVLPAQATQINTKGINIDALSNGPHGFAFSTFDNKTPKKSEMPPLQDKAYLLNTGELAASSLSS